ncbi:hypothetical protein QBC46DRAFT_399364 [Diplogelasinospora grovesii]|uniref:Uncharacterized protein n=1 Tax=Diplogelasinospora grovesii TaxID=303347 RepID=A0AAN6RZW4_9PEZI|nr:hypothetical protein QBC46DRAFT_399364 [Diplogelasinospora grovesii]
MDQDNRQRSHNIEDMALLDSQHHSAGEAALAYSRPNEFGQDEPEATIVDVADIWTEFEVRRRSAEYYLNRYFECMDRITTSVFASGDLDPPSPSEALSSRASPDGERGLMRLKIYTDSLLRDLIAMEETLARAQGIHDSAKPPIFSPIPAVWTLGCSLSAIAVPVRAVVGASIAGAVVGAIAIAAPPVRHAIQSHNLKQICLRLRHLKSAVANGDDLTKYHDDLTRSHFATLRQVAADIKANRGAVVEI